MSRAFHWFLAGSLLLACSPGCDSGGSRSTPATTQAPATQAPAQTQAPSAQAPAGVVTSGPAIEGRVVGVPAESDVFLVRPTEANDLRAMADTIVDVSATDASGAYSLSAGETPSSELSLLVSAPGKALTWGPLGEELDPAPEARVHLEVVDAQGTPLELAFALVLDGTGTPLPVPVASLVSDEAGRIQVTRLPEGACELIVGSVDHELVASRRLTLAAGQTYEERLVLAEDFELSKRYLITLGGPEVAAAFEEAGQ